MNKQKQITNKISKGIYHQVPSDVKKVLTSTVILIEKWESLTPIQRNEWICWVTMAKKEETRKKRISRMVEELKEGARQPCCWPGCPHRRPAAQKWFKKLDT